MNLLCVSFAAAAASRKTFRGFVSLNVKTYNIVIRDFATAATGNLESEMSRSRRSDCVIFNTLICQMCKAEGLNRASQLLDEMRREKGSSSTNHTYGGVFNDEMFSPSSIVNLNDVLRGFIRIGEMNRRGDSVNYNTLISDMCKAKELSHAVELLDHMWWVKGLTPNETTYTSLIDYLCKHDDRIDEAYKILNEMIVGGFFPSVDTLNDVLRGFLRIGEIGKANQMRNKMGEHFYQSWIDEDTYSSLLHGLADEVTYTSLMNACYDQGESCNAVLLLTEMTHLDKYLCGRQHCDLLPDSVIYSVFINGLDNKVRTTETKKHLLRFIYDHSLWLYMSTFEYCATLLENCSDDEYKSLVELFCNTCLDNAYDTMLKWNYKPDGRIVYNLFIIEHCKLSNNVDQAYNMYKEMVHRGFACHMFTVLALIQTLYMEGMANEPLWVIQNILRSCNLNDSEILKFLIEFNPEGHNNEALFDVLAEKVKDGLFLECSYAPASA